jgi:hypothetical protein
MVSSGLLRRVALVRTDVSEEPGATPLYPQKLALTFVDKWQSSVGIVRLRTKGHGVCLFGWLVGLFMGRAGFIWQAQNLVSSCEPIV